MTSVARIALTLALIAAIGPASAATDSNHVHASATAPKTVKAKPTGKKPKAVKAAKPVRGAAKTAAPVAAAPPQPVTPPPQAPTADTPKLPDPKQAVHFAALRAEKVNLRSGPSDTFPIQWVYVRRGLPVEVVASYDIWRKIRDSDGTEGWVNQQMLSGHRSILVSGAVRDLRRDPKPDAEIVAKLEVGVVGAISKCDPTWCEIKAGGYKGWLMRAEVWGLEPGELIE